MVRKSVEIDPKLLAVAKEISEKIGLDVDQIINLAMYELARRLGYLKPQPINLAPPPGHEQIKNISPGAMARFASAMTTPEAPRGQASRPPSPGPVVIGKTSRLIPPERQRRPTRSANGKPVRSATSSVLFFQDNDGPPNPIRKDVFLIGRGSKCDFVIQHRSVSREHAIVTRESDGWFIEDLNSANGTWYNGMQIRKQKIDNGDEIQISNHTLRFLFRSG